MNTVSWAKLAIASIGLAAGAAQADVYTSTLGEFNGAGPYALYPVTEYVGTFSVPTGQTILSATISGTFGNSSFPNTALALNEADGIVVAACTSTSDPCWTAQSPTAWNYTFASSDYGIFADGAVVFNVVQTGDSVDRVGVTTLTITTAVPEPETYALMLGGLGLLAFVARRRRG